MQDALQWYEQGTWPLVGAVAVVMISHAVSIVIVYQQASATFKAQLKKNRVDLLEKQLTELYDPLFSFIKINRFIFNTLGPNTFPDSEIERNAAGEVWKQAKQRVILKNNRLISILLESKSHLLHNSDSLKIT